MQTGLSDLTVTKKTKGPISGPQYLEPPLIKNNLITAFVADTAWTPDLEGETRRPSLISGVTIEPLNPRKDQRGQLTELLTLREGDIEPIVHVYQVHCEPGSIRGWVYHRWQEDRLCYTEGHFRLALYDLREESETYGALDVLDLGADNPSRVTIPKYVAHALMNAGTTISSFVNLPTRPQ